MTTTHSSITLYPLDFNFTISIINKTFAFSTSLHPRCLSLLLNGQAFLKLILSVLDSALAYLSQSSFPFQNDVYLLASLWFPISNFLDFSICLYIGWWVLLIHRLVDTRTDIRIQAFFILGTFLVKTHYDSFWSNSCLLCLFWCNAAYVFSLTALILINPWASAGL